MSKRELCDKLEGGREISSVATQALSQALVLTFFFFRSQVMIQLEGRRKAAGRGHRRAAKVDSSTVMVEGSCRKAQPAARAALALAGCLAALAGVAGHFAQTRRFRNAGNRFRIFRRLLASERRRVAVAVVSLTTRGAVESGPSSSSSLLDMIDA